MSNEHNPATDRHKIVYRKIDELIPAEYNPRVCTKEQEEAIRKSLERDGFLGAVIVNVHPNRKNIIISGHQRSRIWKSMGHRTVPCIEVEKATIKEEQMSNLGQNRAHASWDYDGVANLDLDLSDLFEVGFTALELQLDDFDIQLRQTLKKEFKPGDVIGLNEFKVLCFESEMIDNPKEFFNKFSGFNAICTPTIAQKLVSNFKKNDPKVKISLNGLAIK